MAVLGSAGQGAATGAAIGSVIPGIGTLIGGAIGGLGGLLGGLFGGPSQDTVRRLDVAPMSEEEKRYREMTQQQLSGLQGAFGQQNYDQFNSQVGGINQNYLSLLQQLSQSGGVPTAGQTSSANQFFQQVYAPQQEQLRQNFVQDTFNAQQQAARMGRNINDPVLQAKLIQQRNNAQGMLNAQIGSGAAQYAMQLPGMQAQYAGAAANQVNQLAQNAAQNRMTLLGLGNQLAQQQQNFRLSSAGGTMSTSTGGSLGGGIGGFIGGFGQGAQGFGNIAQMFPETFGIKTGSSRG